VIFDELVIHNFGPYRGRQVITLTPPANGKPVILFGGLNGAGKTSLLDALQLALFGKRARVSNRGTLPYDEYLRQCIHNRTDPAEGAALELAFRHRTAGKENTYRIMRYWRVVKAY